MRILVAPSLQKPLLRVSLGFRAGGCVCCSAQGCSSCQVESPHNPLPGRDGAMGGAVLPQRGGVRFSSHPLASPLLSPLQSEQQKQQQEAEKLHRQERKTLRRSAGHLRSKSRRGRPLR